MPITPTYIVNDQPTDKDALDFTPYVETLTDIIQTGNTPLTIGVFGTWRWDNYLHQVVMYCEMRLVTPFV